ncbi:T9SS type A sorting domain-containing protein [Puia sp. P3]|uniref:T9SS type A sorting domain-containing protein n=1 Tax=Puia sp. P3 TaxID=3423952 RepID=UPI003D6709B0
MTFEVVDQITTVAGSLPLTLIDFSALHTGNDAKLQWTTASEQNTSGFEIQRGDNSGDFATVGRMPAAGHSEATLHYNYTDRLPATATPAWFYRLKMVDLDGAFTYSPILKFNVSGPGPVLSAWPNPFRGQLTVTLEAAEADKGRLSIRDPGGRLVIGQDLSIQKGTNSIPLNSLGGLAKGVYLLNIATSRGQETLRVLKSD